MNRPDRSFDASILSQAFDAGQTVPEFIESARCHKPQWQKHFSSFSISETLRRDLEQLGQRIPALRALIITEDWCPDSVMNTPVLEHVAEALGQMEVRVVRRTAFWELANGFPGADGRSHVPTVVFTDTTGQCRHWSERCAENHKWFNRFIGDYPMPAFQFMDGIPSAELESWMKLRMSAEQETYLTTFCWATIEEWKQIIERFAVQAT